MNRSKCCCPLSLVIFNPDLVAAKNSNSREFQIAPYAWLAGMDGQIATLPGLPPAEVDINFYDVGRIPDFL